MNNDEMILALLYWRYANRTEAEEIANNGLCFDVKSPKSWLNSDEYYRDMQDIAMAVPR